jgi:hypothetical protein
MIKADESLKLQSLKLNQTAFVTGGVADSVGWFPNRLSYSAEKAVDGGDRLMTIQNSPIWLTICRNCSKSIGFWI